MSERSTTLARISRAQTALLTDGHLWWRRPDWKRVPFVARIDASCARLADFFDAAPIAVFVALGIAFIFIQDSLREGHVQAAATALIWTLSMVMLIGTRYRDDALNRG